MREDTFSRDEAGAREWAHILGRSEDFGGHDSDEVPIGGIPRLGPDPWLPWSCQRCGQDDPHGMPKNCACGMENY